MLRLLIALALAGICVPGTQAQTTRVDAAPPIAVAFVGGIQFDRTQFERPEQRFGGLTLLGTSSNGISIGATAGLEFERFISVLVEPALIQFEDDQPSATLSRVTFGVRLHPRLRSLPLAPYFSLGYSLVSPSEESDDVTTRSVTVAGGLVVALGDNVGLSLNLRSVPLVSEDRFAVESSVFQFGAGFLFFAP